MIDVLIAGAGPVGLTAAIVLTQRGRHVQVIDDQAAGANTSRAAVVHAHTLELLAPYGASPDLVARGVPVPAFSIRDRDTTLLKVPFGGLPTAYPYTLMIPQADTEALLLRRLEHLGGHVLRPVTLTDATQHHDGIAAVCADGRKIDARYLLGADGLHSTVRRTAGIDFTGGTYADAFVLADVRLSGGLGAEEVILYFSPAGLVVVAPLPQGRHRIVATVDEAPAEPDAAFVQRLLDERGPQAQPAVVEQIVWSSRFRVHHRIADTFRSDRMLLAGDAAHVHSPAGGQGMNLGIEDAVAAGEALDRVLDGAPESLLDAYATERKRTAEGVIALAGRLTDLATLPPGRRRLRNTALRMAGTLPAVRRAAAYRLSGVDRR
ncbi:FAD-dependent oxidoreductase [Mycolicibacterium neoaurum]|uniref:Pentachlorophenol 4-monooxygenase n=1 Tax=Mycolicibacterium neoaurum TaxID=1795 RepID=A0AAV2WQN3_MYCNE|nr:NAD(P)/FAD-dependent oxidoreductase [Mycolicibacterium neoaurum]TLH58727.1 FAD-dependent monooxygenase [Mycolicibacterium neoaurum]CDQ46258.1 pentachlorophenol 4-monooxygenase [Mycolicibacterium neoaurum]